MLRYTVLRLLIFFGFLVFFWLVGLRDNKVLLLGAAAVASALASYALLRGMRDEVTARLMDRHEAKLRAREEGAPSVDELAEDREADAER
jgi:hypothetical protein